MHTQHIMIYISVISLKGQKYMEYLQTNVYLLKLFKHEEKYNSAIVNKQHTQQSCLNLGDRQVTTKRTAKC